MADIYKNNFALGLAVVARKTKRKAYHLPDTYFPSHELLYIDNGEIYTSTNGQRALAKQGDLMVWHRDTKHGQTLEEGQQASTIGINYDGLDKETHAIDIGLYHLDNRARQLIGEALAQAEPNDSGVVVMSEGILKPLLQYLAQGHQSNFNSSATTFQEHQHSILQAMNHMNQHCDQELSLTHMADMFHMSNTYFSRVFKKIAGQSFKAYLTQCRIERAKALLETKEFNITEIAAATGFATIHYFSLVFKRVTGLSPSDYAKKI